MVNWVVVSEFNSVDASRVLKNDQYAPKSAICRPHIYFKYSLHAVEGDTKDTSHPNNIGVTRVYV